MPKPRFYPCSKERRAIRQALGFKDNSNCKIAVIDGDQFPELRGDPAHYTIRGFDGERYIWDYLTGYRLLLTTGPQLGSSRPPRPLPERRTHRHWYTYHASTRRIDVGKFWLGVWRDWQEENPDRPIIEFLKHP